MENMTFDRLFAMLSVADLSDQATRLALADAATECGKVDVASILREAKGNKLMPGFSGSGRLLHAIWSGEEIPHKTLAIKAREEIWRLAGWSISFYGRFGIHASPNSSLDKALFRAIHRGLSGEKAIAMALEINAAER